MFKELRKKVRSILTKIQLRHKGVCIGSGCYISNVDFEKGTSIIEDGCRIIGDPCVKIGTNLYTNSGTHILGEVYIDNNVLIGPKVVIWGRDHGMEKSKLIRNQSHNKAPIKIGNDVWIGANATILKGVSLGQGAVVGAGSVVTKNVAPYSIVVGNPARKIGERK